MGASDLAVSVSDALEIEIGVLYAVPGQYAVRAIAESIESSDPTPETNEAIAVTTVTEAASEPSPMPTAPLPDPALLPDTATLRFAPTAAALIASAFLLASIVALGARRARR
jgi:hypothetical protein